jgi:hypothetical protein
MRCENIILLAVRFVDVANFTTLSALSLLILCKLSFPIVGSKMSSLPTLALKSHKQMFICSSGQSSWLQIRRSWVRFPGTTRKKKVVGLERGPLSLVSTTEEVLGRNSSGSGLEI